MNTNEAYDIDENELEAFLILENKDGSFTINIPQYFDDINGRAYGVKPETFASRREALRALRNAEHNIEIAEDLAQLQPFFDGHFYQIKRNKNGGFDVALPGLTDQNQRYVFGASITHFKSFETAKKYFLENLRNPLDIPNKPIFTVTHGKHHQTQFMRAEGFDPRIIPSSEPLPIPPHLKSTLLRQEKISPNDPMNDGTYIATVETENWENKTFSIINEILEMHPRILIKLKIKDIKLLTPKQAVLLSNEIVLQTTKYDRVNKHKPSTEADNTSVMEMLRLGLQNKNNPSWNGSGVCRNFSDMVKIIFEVLKKNQHEMNYLQNTYCTKESDRFSNYNKNRADSTSGHAWNAFVTITPEGSTSTITDATWAQIDLDTQETINLDHTLDRIESLIESTISTNIENNQNAIEQLFNYYELVIAQTQLQPQGKNQRERLRNLIKNQVKQHYYIGKLLQNIYRYNISPDLPDFIRTAINYSCASEKFNTDKTELEVIWKLSRTYPDIKIETIIPVYIKHHATNNFEASNAFVFNDTKLQMVLFDYIKNDTELYNKLLQTPGFRSKLRSIAPTLIPTFSPEMNQEDLREYKYLLERADYHLHQRLHRLPYSIGIQKVKESLESINQSEYQHLTNNLTDYQILQQYQQIKNLLSA